MIGSMLGVNYDFLSQPWGITMKDAAKRINLKYGWNVYMEMAEIARSAGMFSFNKETGLVDDYNWKRPKLIAALSEQSKKVVTPAHLKSIMDCYNGFLQHVDKYEQTGVSVEENKLVAKNQELVTALKTQAEYRAKLETKISSLVQELNDKDTVSSDVKKLQDELARCTIENKRLKDTLNEASKIHNAAEIIVAQANSIIARTRTSAHAAAKSNTLHLKA